jgi:hypothetical protein
VGKLLAVFTAKMMGTKKTTDGTGCDMISKKEGTRESEYNA